jgi:hypothetical protein
VSSVYVLGGKSLKDPRRLQVGLGALIDLDHQNQVITETQAVTAGAIYCRVSSRKQRDPGASDRNGPERIPTTVSSKTSHRDSLLPCVPLLQLNFLMRNFFQKDFASEIFKKADMQNSIRTNKIKTTPRFSYDAPH